jgi:hypothetical protein
MRKPLVSSMAFSICLCALYSPVSAVNGNDVLIIGESFIALSHAISHDLDSIARKAGVLSATDTFRDYAVSGTQLSGGITPSIPRQYTNARTSRPVKYVIMDGGGNDCLNATCTTPPLITCQNLQNAMNAAKALLDTMGRDGVLKVMYFFYPDPQGNLQQTLQPKLDTLRPRIQNIVLNQTTPICYWLDLRPTFAGHYSQYIMSDGIHPTATGSLAAANAIWSVVQANNFFGTTTIQNSSPAPCRFSSLSLKAVSRDRVTVSLSLPQTSCATMRLYTPEGRVAATSTPQIIQSGFQTMTFSFNAVSPGVYCTELSVGGTTLRAATLIR